MYRLIILIVFLFVWTICEIVVIKKQKDKIYSGHVLFEVPMPMWSICAQYCSRVKVCKSINFIASTKTCQINYHEPETSECSGLVESIGNSFAAASTFPKELAGQCNGNKCTVNEACMPSGMNYYCVPLPFQLPENSARCTNKGYYYDLYSNACLKMFVDSDGKTWKDARNHCQWNGGDLISLTTLAKWNFVTNFTSCVSGVWIGLKDKQWVTNDIFQNMYNAKVQFNNYDSAYTNDPESVCVAFYSTNPVAVLQDESCNIRLKRTYICEILV